MFEIITCGAEHLAEILEIERASFPDPWTEGMFLDEFANPNVRYFASLDSSGAVAGFAGMSYVLDEGEIRNIAVSPESRRSGAALALLNTLEKYALELKLSVVYLEVRAGNAPAIALYSKLGYVSLGVRHGYYLYPREDAVVMGKIL